MNEIPEGGQVVDSPQPPKKGGFLKRAAPKKAILGDLARLAKKQARQHGHAAGRQAATLRGLGRLRRRATKLGLIGSGPQIRTPRIRSKRPRSPRARRVVTRALRGTRTPGRSSGGRSMSLFGWWRLLKRLASAAKAKPSGTATIRNHGATGSGKNWRTGRAGFQPPRGRLW